MTFTKIFQSRPSPLLVTLLEVYCKWFSTVLIRIPNSSFDILYQHQLSGKTLLNFTPDYCFLVGSPLGLFLTMDVQTENKYLEAFHCLNPKTGKKQLLHDVHVYHLFHPYDPVAYRIDPHLDVKFAQHEPCSCKFLFSI